VVGAEPRPRDAIVEVLHARDASVDRERVDKLLQDDTTFAEVAGGVVHMPSMLEGTAWTVWVDAGDAGDNFVRAEPHLGVMTWWLLGDDVELVDESGAALGVLRVDSMWADEVDIDVVIGPDGWLVPFADGWATVRVVDGALNWTACAVPPEPTSRQVDAMRAGFEAAVRVAHAAAADDRPPPPDARHAVGDNPVHEALVADQQAFREAPVPPLPALYEAAGLEQQGATIAEQGFDWNALREWRDRNRLALGYGLDETQVDQVVFAVGACSLYVADGADALGSTEEDQLAAAMLVAGCLEDGKVAEAFWDESERSVPVADVSHFAVDLASRLDGPVPAGLAWVRARALDLDGDAAGAAALLDAAVTAGSSHGPALIELAGFRADRGDAPGALAALRRAGVAESADDDDPFGEPDDAQRLLDEVRPFAVHRPRPSTGRNDRCPCGSGRKYKVCHLGREQHPLEDRAVWLYQKAKRFLRRRAPDILEDLAREFASASDTRWHYHEMYESPWMADLALHEGLVFAEFVSEREGLLPDDEALLAAQWALVDRGVFEIARADPGRLELYDIGHGEHISVVMTNPTDRVRKGTVLFGRPLPVGDSYRAFGGFIEVSRSWVDDCLQALEEADPAEIAALAGRTMRPPQMKNTDGENLAFHTIRWRCREPDHVDGLLRRAGLNGDRDTGWSLVRDSANQPSTVVAHLLLTDGELIADVNSDPRANEIRALVATAVPDAELIDDNVRSFDQAMAEYDPDDGRGPMDVNDPAVQNAFRQFIAEHERRWLDESIPALGGRTPRDAALDPVGREELNHLLDSFPIPERSDIAMMDPERLRHALGL
jgi:hypothetical protein